MKAGIIVGLLIILLCILVYFDPIIYHQPVPKELSFVFLVGGLIWIVSVFVNEKKIAKDKSILKYALFVICPKCQAPFENQEVKDGICLNCGGPVENLHGFYDRNPEFKE